MLPKGETYEFKDNASALRHAETMAKKLACFAKTSPGHHLRVRDEDGNVIARIPLVRLHS